MTGAYFGRRPRWSKTAETNLVNDAMRHKAAMDDVARIVGSNTAEAWKLNRMAKDRLVMTEITQAAAAFLDELTNEQ